VDHALERKPPGAGCDCAARWERTAFAHQPVGLLLQGRAGGARDQARYAAPVREPAVRRIDDGVDGFLQQVAADDLEDAARRGIPSRGYFFLREDFFLRRGTFAPARRASDRPIAIACLRLFTVLPERPLFSLPRLRSCIALLTFCCAFFP
jgi:hypothetical protein